MMWSFLTIIVTLIIVRRRNLCRLYLKLLSQVRVVRLGRMMVRGLLVVLILVLVVLLVLLDLIPKFRYFQVLVVIDKL